MHKLNFLEETQIEKIENDFETPVYVYSESKLLEASKSFLDFPSAFWHSVRYAMKANSNINILRIFKNKWLKVDCSSDYEAYRAINSGFHPSDIQISGQETSEKLVDLLERWIFFVATSLKQLKYIWDMKPWAEIWVRINPWVWSGAFAAISTGWVTSSFGIWHEYIPQIKAIAREYNLNITKIHIHIWSENTPESWTNSASIWLDIVSQFENATTLNMWGGFKKAIMPYEKSADLQSIWKSVTNKFEEFYKKTGRKIHLEVEPWKYMVINSCSVIAKVDDIVDTWGEGYKFIRLNTWMTEMPRVPMYGVQQPIIAINSSKKLEKYVIVWHCCESGDILTSKLYDPEIIEPITFPEVSIWDTLVIEWTGAYNASMSMKNYNSYPEAGELLVRKNGEIVEIRKRQKLTDIWKNEVKII
jgi:diaminopimelate decarboxylase